MTVIYFMLCDSSLQDSSQNDYNVEETLFFPAVKKEFQVVVVSMV